MLSYKKIFLLASILITALYAVFSSFRETPSYVKIPTYVNGHSMEPTLPHGTNICLLKNFYASSENIKSGDIVGIHFNGTGMNMVKRVIGTPGDQIVFGKDGYIYRNGERMKENYITGNPKFFLTPGFSRVLLQIERFGGVIPKDMFLILGDNRRNSIDSSEYGLIHFDQILGKVEVMKRETCSN
jgi:signal peptidase I